MSLQLIRKYLAYFFIVFELFNGMLFINFRINSPVLFLIAIISLVTLLLSKEKGDKKEFIWSVILLVSLIGVTLFNIKIVDGLAYTINALLLHVIYMFLLFNNGDKSKDEKFYENIYIIIVIFTILVSLFSLGATYLLQFNGFAPDNRFVGLYVHPNLAGIIALASISLSVGLLKLKKLNIMLIANIIIQLIVLFLCKSRSIFMIGIISAGLFILLKFGNKINKKYLFVGLVLIGILSFIYISKNRKIDYSFVGSSSLFTYLDTLSSARVSLGRDVINLATRSPIYGNGIRTMTYNAEHYLSYDSVIVALGHNNSHNLLIDAFYVNGIIGLGLVFYLFYMLYNRIKDNYLKKINYMEIIILVQILIFSFIDKGILYVQGFMVALFWLLMGRISKEEKYIDNQ